MSELHIKARNGELRRRDKRFRESYPHVDWFIGWCPHAARLMLGDSKALDYNDGRCLNWLRVCEKTGMVVVHNKKCDVPEVKREVRAYPHQDCPKARERSV